MSDDLTPEIAAAIANERWDDVPKAMRDGYAAFELAMEAARVLAAENERLKALLVDIAQACRGVGFPGEVERDFDQLPAEINRLWTAHDDDNEILVAVGGLSPEATRWAIRIASSELRFTNPRPPASACPPGVRAEIPSESGKVTSSWWPPRTPTKSVDYEFVPAGGE